MAQKNDLYKVFISDDASRMLVSHSRFLTQVSEMAAIQLIEEFNVKAKSLERFPERNPWFCDSIIPPGKYRKLLMAKRYLMVFQVLNALEEKLNWLDDPPNGKTTLTLFDECKLNRITVMDSDTYVESTTELTEEQIELLKQLDLAHLTGKKYLNQRLEHSAT